MVVPADGGMTTTLRFSLVRAPRFPDPATDHGPHHFRHAVVPGASIGDAVRAGYRINLTTARSCVAEPVEPLLIIDLGAGPHVCPANSMAYPIAQDAIDQLLDALPKSAARCQPGELIRRPGSFEGKCVANRVAALMIIAEFVVPTDIGSDDFPPYSVVVENEVGGPNPHCNHLPFGC